MAEIKNLKKVANRILKAIKKEEKIIIYGDADLDGVSSVIILQEAIRNSGGEITALYFPDREKDGYGINEKGLSFLKKYSPALLLVLDCGISNFKEAVKAKKMGFKVIIVDHHEVLDKLPEADIIVDPKQKGDKYPFKQFATAGIVFKLSELILKEKITLSLRKDFLELTALATIADMMPRVDENEEMIIEGLSYLKETWRPGLEALLELDLKVNQINSLLNIRDVENGLPASFRLLTAPDKKEAKILAEKLLKKGIEKRRRIKEITQEIEARIIRKEKKPIIFEGDSNWELIFLGVIASILSQRYQKPAFLFKKDKKESQASNRAPAGFNTVEAMKKCSKHLVSFGGHAQASGFRIKNKDLENFKECLIEQFE